VGQAALLVLILTFVHNLSGEEEPKRRKYKKEDLEARCSTGKLGTSSSLW
jgi:hypothetical protein